MQDFEKLGVFYLGRTYDTAARRPTEDLLLYESKDLVTHALTVGMTGSGKTGLGISVIEEAAIDGIPALVIDPKGDLTNLLLTFPDLAPADFRPWINEEDAHGRGVTPDEFAAAQAQVWKDGLGRWGEDGARIRRMKAAADFTIYTPGSNAGVPVSILKSFDAPPSALNEDGEAFRDRISTTVSSLLSLLAIGADPLQSREHILLSNLFARAWQAGQSLDLPALIEQIQTPPVPKIGVMTVDAFFPAKDRFSLAMALNNLLAAPGFSGWMEGVPLDIQSLLYTPAGKPRVAILSIAHLGETERTFFVSLLLNEVLGWMRTQSGTTSLRALLYMDEIYGYFPPVANPPTKKPLLTLLKQARAYGLGVFLSTQNSVDLDYKGLANCGTWFIGRLQTERDVARVMDGLSGAAQAAGKAFDAAAMRKTIAGLPGRVFMMNNVHEDAPVAFETRWALSYLRGPLGRLQIKQLMDPVKAAAVNQTTAASGVATVPKHVAVLLTSQNRPAIPSEITQVFLPLRSDPKPGATLSYEPAVLGLVAIYFTDAKRGVSERRDLTLVAPVTNDVVSLDWHNAHEIAVPEGDLGKSPPRDGRYEPLAGDAAQAKCYDAWKKQLADFAYRNQAFTLRHNAEFDLISKPEETEQSFGARLDQAKRERRDALQARLRAKYEPKHAALQDRRRRAEQALAVQQDQARQSKVSTAISIGTTILGAFLGRKTMSASTISRAGTAMRGTGRAYQESGDVGRAAENIAAVDAGLQKLQRDFDDDIAAEAAKLDAAAGETEELTIKPKKADVTVKLVALAWCPYYNDESGNSVPAWE